MKKEIHLCDYGCGQIGSYFLKSVKKYCCHKDYMYCFCFKQIYFDKIIKLIEEKGGKCLSDKRMQIKKYKTYSHSILGGKR